MNNWEDYICKINFKMWAHFFFLHFISFTWYCRSGNKCLLGSECKLLHSIINESEEENRSKAAKDIDSTYDKTNKLFKHKEHTFLESANDTIKQSK